MCRIPPIGSSLCVRDFYDARANDTHGSQCRVTILVEWRSRMIAWLQPRPERLKVPECTRFSLLVRSSELTVMPVSIESRLVRRWRSWIVHSRRAPSNVDNSWLPAMAMSWEYMEDWALTTRSLADTERHVPAVTIDASLTVLSLRFFSCYALSMALSSMIGALNRVIFSLAVRLKSFNIG